MKRTILLVGVLLGSLFPASPAVAAPAIAFLNPSSYTTSDKISDAEDRDGFVHLVAWAREIPSSALVEFELKPPAQNAATFTAERVGADTFEAFVPIPDSYPDVDGYTLTARLYRGVPGDADEVAAAEMLVEVDQAEVPPPAGTVEMSYPENGDPAGFFTPKGKRSNVVIDYKASPSTNRVRTFYTLSDPGVAPVWEKEACGVGTPDEEGFGKVRCTLKEGHNPLDVSALAIVSNKTAPPAPPGEALDDTGDAHRVLPYLQDPRSVEVSPGGTVTLSACHYMTAAVEDQFNRRIAGVNLDVHAEGPEDELYFASQPNQPNQTDAFQAPDTAHVSKENAKLCSSTENSGQQGDHNSPGRDDVKHIESTAGSSDAGTFRFALRSDFTGGTFVTVFADVNDDDALGLSEASGGTQLGWGTPPPPPALDVFLTPSSASGSTGSCVAFEILARKGGGAFAAANVDIHISGPDATANFCDAPGGSPRRVPESGGHIQDTHEDGTRHVEGETDSGGKFVFGVTSETPGTTNVSVWIDSNDDDLLSGEPSKSGTVTFQPPGDRTISISSNRSSVAKGRRVRLAGTISGDPSCSGGQPVAIQAKPVRGGRFGTVKTVTTDEEGNYTTRIKMRKSRKFRASVSAMEPCSAAQSRTITVRVR